MNAIRGTPAWGPARTRLALLAITSSTVSAAILVTLGGTADFVYGAVALLASVIAALFTPAWIAGQLIVSLALAGAVVLDGRDPLLLLPCVVTMTATTELLAATARLDSPVRPALRGVFRRTGLSAAIGAVVFAAVALVGRFQAPTGLLAIGLAAGALVGLAILLVPKGEADPR